MVQTFAVFVDGPTTAKIKTMKVFTYEDIVPVPTAMWHVHGAPKIAAVSSTYRC